MRTYQKVADDPVSLSSGLSVEEPALTCFPGGLFAEGLQPDFQLAQKSTERLCCRKLSRQLGMNNWANDEATFLSRLFQ